MSNRLKARSAKHYTHQIRGRMNDKSGPAVQRTFWILILGYLVWVLERRSKLTPLGTPNRKSLGCNRMSEEFPNPPSIHLRLQTTYQNSDNPRIWNSKWPPRFKIHVAYFTRLPLIWSEGSRWSMYWNISNKRPVKPIRLRRVTNRQISIKFVTFPSFH